ncbi:MAG: hypothetical protein MJ192_00965 [Clostridia bacterium]|nr:hypothetical protein [Clostridia bacterium]
MKKVKSNDGIAAWKIDNGLERFLGKCADRGEFGKRLYVGFYRLFDAEYYKKGLKFIDRNIEAFVPGGVTEKQHKQYVRDMVYSLHRFGCMFDEYFMFRYPVLNTKGREAFITDKKRWDYYARMNRDENKILFNDKEKAYELFGKYYHRELIKITGEGDKELFSAFAARHTRFIVKPYDGSGGKGIAILDSADFSDTDALFAEVLSRGTTVCEELIKEVPELQALHPSSINTVRVPTVLAGGEVHIFCPFMRIGKGGSVVDNAASGGVFAAVDPDTGIVTSRGIDEHGHEFLVHPDTGFVIPGFRIPRWDEAVALVNELARVVEGNHYCGWDLALTEDGWIMVEGNPRGQLVEQYVTHNGCREELEKLIGIIEKENTEA